MATKLASLASEATGKGLSPEYVSFLDSVVAAWAANEEVSLKGKIS